MAEGDVCVKAASAKGVSKAVPILGGVVSGGLTGNIQADGSQTQEAPLNNGSYVTGDTEGRITVLYQ